jgi:hypothetical protein
MKQKLAETRAGIFCVVERRLLTEFEIENISKWMNHNRDNVHHNM